MSVKRRRSSPVVQHGRVSESPHSVAGVYDDSGFRRANRLLFRRENVDPVVLSAPPSAKTRCHCSRDRPLEVAVNGPSWLRAWMDDPSRRASGKKEGDNQGEDGQAGYSANPHRPTRGTKRHPPRNSFMAFPDFLYTWTRSCSHLPPMGITSMPPSPSCSNSGTGTLGAAAVTRIRSKGASSGTPIVPSPTRKRTFSRPSSRRTPSAEAEKTENRSMLTTSRVRRQRMAVWYPDPVPISSTFSAPVRRRA